MKQIAALTVLSLMVVACGAPGNHPEKFKSIQTSMNPIMMEKSVANCSASGFEKGETSFDLNLFLEGKNISETRDFSSLIDGLYVRDPQKNIIAKSVYGSKVDFMARASGNERMTSLVEVTPGKDVIICPDHKAYDRNSIESATLNTAFYVQQVYNKVAPLIPESIKPITLNINSLIKDTVRYYQPDGVHLRYEYHTDNAYYMAGDNSITILPHSQEIRNYGFKLNFWDIPMMPAHEYGHHIFQTLAPYQGGNNLISGCFSDGQPTTLVAMDESYVEAVSNAKVEKSLNEGFADLIAFYSLSDRERNVKGVILRGLFALEMDREVNFERFSNFDRKEFSDNVLYKFFNNIAPNEHDGVRFAMNYTDEHIIGAIFAHKMEKFMTSLLATKEQKLKITVEWARLYGKQRPQMKNLKPRDYMESSLRLFIKAAMSQMGRTYDQAVCKNVTETYPDFKNTVPDCQIQESVW